MSLFPIIQPQVETQADVLPLYREVAWDYKTNTPIWRGGSPYVVTGADAVLSWIYRALQVVRYRHEIYTWNYGNECETLIGTAYTDELKQAEAARYVKECLLVNPYIEEVSDVVVSFDGETLGITCTVVTIYGEVSVNV
ncbi:MAG: DUF2634 domain-containing protein [Candidatus Fimivivens sp.]|nr:DUF2634 domain-containing protein [Candidatus Fimivivens sp.]